MAASALVLEAGDDEDLAIESFAGVRRFGETQLAERDLRTRVNMIHLLLQEALDKREREK